MGMPKPESEQESVRIFQTKRVLFIIATCNNNHKMKLYFEDKIR